MVIRLWYVGKLFAVLAACWFSVSTAEANSTLTVTRYGSGSGTVSSNVGTVNCGTVCSDSYSDGTMITLTAAPDGGSQFTGWLGPCTGSGTCQFTINGNTTVEATFASPPITTAMLDIDGVNGCDALTDGVLIVRYLLGLTGNALTAGAVGPGASRASATQIQPYLLDVKPALDIDGDGHVDPLTDGLLALRFMFGFRAGSLVANATGSGAIRDASGIQTQMQSLCTPPVPSYALNVSRTGTGFGSVTSAPAGIDCGADCSESYAAGTMVTLTATASNGSTFGGWSGACSGSGSCMVTMDAARAVSAGFTFDCPDTCIVERYSVDGSAPPSPASARLGLTTPPRTDIGFVVNTNFEMNGAMSSFKSSAATIIDSLKAKVPDLGVGIAGHEDIPTAKYSMCGPAPFYTCPAGFSCFSYGTPGNWCTPNAHDYSSCDNTVALFSGNGLAASDDPYYQLTGVTTDKSAAVSAANGLRLGNGEDLPQGQVLALHRAVSGAALSWPALNNCAAGSRPAVVETSTNFGALGFRKDALPIVVGFSSAEFHNGVHATATMPGASPAWCIYSPGSATCSTAAYAPEESYAFTEPHISDLASALTARGARFVGGAVDDSRAARNPAGGTVYTSGPSAGIAGTSAARNANWDFGAYGDMAYLTDQTGSLVPPGAFAHDASCAVGQCCTGFNGAGVAPDGAGGACRLVFNVNHDGAGVGAQVVNSVTALLNSIQFDVFVQAYNDAAEVIDVVGNFIQKIEPDPSGGTDPVTGQVCFTFSPAQLADDFIGPKALAAGADGVNDTIRQINPAPLYCFNVTPKANTTVTPNASTQSFRAWLRVRAINPAGGSIALGADRQIVFVVPPAN